MNTGTAYRALLFGGIPLLEGPGQLDIISGLGGVLLLAAGSIALVLRPVAKHLLIVERTATAIAGGEFSARVDVRQAKSAVTLARAVNKMAEQVESMHMTQRMLLQAVSHELHTPLSRLHHAIDQVLDAKNDQQLEERLNRLELEVQAFDELVGVVLRYVRTSEFAILGQEFNAL